MIVNASCTLKWQGSDLIGTITLVNESDRNVPLHGSIYVGIECPDKYTNVVIWKQSSINLGSHETKTIQTTDMSVFPYPVSSGDYLKCDVFNSLPDMYTVNTSDPVLKINGPGRILVP